MQGVRFFHKASSASRCAVEILPSPERKAFQYRTAALKYKVLVSTWNVGGLEPSDGLDLAELLQTKEAFYDIYVLGFQELVPLNVKNVVGPQWGRICLRWNSLINWALNNNNNNNNIKYEEMMNCIEYECIISKQMVGIMVSVWAKRELREDLHHPRVSSIGCGFSGFFGNKGSVSVRFVLHGTSMCFVCCHLASGGKEGHVACRNSDFLRIISRTRFPRISPIELPIKIFDHDRIILLGDLNYRISLPETETRSLLERKDWNLLLKKDQLLREVAEGRIFKGWNEGRISFFPTYKYHLNSDTYYGGFMQGNVHGKQRAPAWCDRILWYGNGIKQSQYDRCELNLSDHRPVRSIFVIEVDAPPLPPLQPPYDRLVSHF